MQWHVRVVSCALFLFILLFILHVILLFFLLFKLFFFLSYSWHSVLLCITFMCKKKMSGWKFQGTRLGKCRCFLSWSCEWVNLGVGMVVSHLRVLHCPLHSPRRATVGEKGAEIWKWTFPGQYRLLDLILAQKLYGFCSGNPG